MTFCTLSTIGANDSFALYFSFCQIKCSDRLVVNIRSVLTDVEASFIKGEVERSSRRHLYQQYLVERSRSQEEEHMSLVQHWTYFLSNKLHMLHRRYVGCVVTRRYVGCVVTRRYVGCVVT